jgi:hypothetical protein
VEYVNYAFILSLHHTDLFGVRFGVPAEGVVKQYLFSVLSLGGGVGRFVAVVMLQCI